MISGRVPMRAARRPKRRASSSTTSGPGAIAMPALTMPQPQTLVRNVTLARNIAVNDSPNTAVARLPQRKLGMRNRARSSAGAGCDRERSTKTTVRTSPMAMAPIVRPSTQPQRRSGRGPARRHRRRGRGCAEPTRSGNGPGSASRDSTRTRRPSDEGDDAHRQVDEEHPAPADGVDEEAAERGPEGGGDRAHRAPDGDGDRHPLPGVARSTRASDVGVMAAAPIACTIRAAIRKPAVGASPHVAEAIVNRGQAAQEHRLRPHRSASRPAGTSRAANTSV